MEHMEPTECPRCGPPHIENIPLGIVISCNCFIHAHEKTDLISDSRSWDGSKFSQKVETRALNEAIILWNCGFLGLGGAGRELDYAFSQLIKAYRRAFLKTIDKIKKALL